MLEAKENFLSLRQEIPLTNDELAAVQDGVAAYENLLTRLFDLPTPAVRRSGALTAMVWSRSQLDREQTLSHVEPGENETANEMTSLRVVKHALGCKRALRLPGVCGARI